MDEIQELTEREVAAIGRHSRELDAREPRIASVSYEGDRLVFDLKGSAINGARVSFPARELPGLESATDAQLSAHIVTGSGSSVRWEELGVGIGAPALVRLVCGLDERLAAASTMGSARSAAKSAAARANGIKGGRPRQKPVDV